MADDPTKPPTDGVIPESLRRQLEAFRRELWRRKITEAVLAAFFGLIVSFFLVFILDRFWTTPGPLRLVALLGGISLFAVFVPLWLHRWVWKHRREGQLARLIARRYPGLGDRLLGVVELEKQTETSETLSPRLRAAAMEAVAAEVERRKLDTALPGSKHRRWMLTVGATVLIFIAAIVIAPKAMLSSLRRWISPFSATERYTFTILRDLPPKLYVPQGEAFSLPVTLAGDTEWKPSSGTARYASQDPVNAALEHGGYHFDFPGQRDPGRLVVEIGDYTKAVDVLPTLRPAVRKTTGLVQFPGYLQIPGREVDLSTGVVQAVQGSKVKITIDATRDLQRAKAGVQEMSIDGPSATTPPLDVVERAGVLPLAWTDTLGLDGAKGFQVRIDPLPDAPPSAYIQGIDRQKVILPEETVDFEALTEDDFGIREMGIEWSGELPSTATGKAASGSLKLLTGGPDQPRLSQKVAFSPATFNITPQKLTVRVYVEDYLPDRGRIYSQPITLHILTRDEHAQMLKTRFDRSIGELEDLARKERNLLEENQRLEKLTPEELQSEDGKKRLQVQQDAERQQTERMKELSQKMEELFKDSARNGTIDKDTLKKMAEAMKSIDELAKEDLPGVDKKLGDAQDQRNTPEKSAKDMKEATERQEQAVEKMQKAAEKANDANQNFEAGTFVNRLKKAASDEDGVHIALWDAKANLGLRTAELDPHDAGLLQDATRLQANTSSDVRWIREDLEHFFARSNKPAFREIVDDMNSSRIEMGLEEIRTRMQAQQSFIAAAAAKKWSAKLTEWAKKLEGEAQKNGGGGAGSGNGNQEDEDFEFMLRVMKMVQQEQDLRARTRSLETLRRAYESPAEAKP
ncbi:MAG: hypothetical protein JWO82_4050 [Akkermansiaceae bacterium]|nr:hypothetical protein [Akkermansiaceae bacterium]